MLIGYCRVSTTEQNLDRQIKSLKNYGCERIYCDKSTGKNEISIKGVWPIRSSKSLIFLSTSFIITSKIILIYS